MRMLTTAVLLISLSSSLPFASADEEPHSLPPAVKAAVSAMFPGAEIEEADLHVEPGFSFYEVHLSDADSEMHMVVTSDGTVIEVHQEADTSKLPAAVKATLTKLSPKAEIEGGRRNERRSKLALQKLPKAQRLYEVVLGRGRRLASVLISEDGYVVEGLRWEDPEEHDEFDEFDDEDEEPEEPEEDEDRELKEDGSKSREVADDEDDEDEDEEMPKLNAAAKGAIFAAFPGADPKVVDIHEEHDQEVYSVMIQQPGVEKLVNVTKKGLILTVQTHSKTMTLPKAVADTLEKLSRDAKIEESSLVEVRAAPRWVKLEKAEIIYELAIVRKDAVSMLVLREDGTLVEGLRWESADESERRGDKEDDDMDEDEDEDMDEDDED